MESYSICSIVIGYFTQCNVFQIHPYCSPELLLETHLEAEECELTSDPRPEFRKGVGSWVVISLSRRLAMALLAFPGHPGKKSADRSPCLLPSPFQGPLKSPAAKRFPLKSLCRLGRESGHCWQPGQTLLLFRNQATMYHVWAKFTF